MHYYRWLKHGDLHYERIYTRAPRKTCSVEGCERLVTGRGWCANHYYYWRTYGTVDHVPHGTPEDRFWAKVDCSGDCWLWTAGRDRDGYGVFRYRNRQWRAPRVAWTLERGEIPDGMAVMHSCDNPPCVNIAHLSLGTNAENAADASRKGRRRPGSQNPNAKLTEAQVVEIRARYAAGVPVRDMAPEYQVSLSLIGHIVTRRAWRHI